LCQRALADQPLDDGRAELPTNRLVELDPVELHEVGLLRLQVALELRERNLLAIDLGGVRRAGKRQIDAPEYERDGDEAQDNDDDDAAESVTYSLQHGSPEKVSDTSSGKMSRETGVRHH